jgi:hypothetical protein
MHIEYEIKFNNILVISWRSVVLVEETGEPGENHRPATSQSLMTTESPSLGTFLG